VKRYAVLLRGVNLGPRNRLKMADFRAALSTAGFDDVRTLLQSGNAAVAHPGSVSAVEKAVREALAELGLDVEVIVRTASAMRKVVADDPLGDVASDPKRHFVVFCSQPLDPGLLPEANPPELLVARRREVHVWAPLGVRAGTVMNALGRRPPAPVTTFRNWSTVTKLAELLAG
jgi:uncharacterized protein (DUF1697 family)